MLLFPISTIFFYEDNQQIKCCLLWSSAPSSTQADASTRRDNSSETGDVHNLDGESTAGQQAEQPVSQQIDASFERENVKDGGDGEGLPRDKQVSSSSNSSDLSTEGSTEISNGANTAIDPGDHS